MQPRRTHLTAGATVSPMRGIVKSLPTRWFDASEACAEMLWEAAGDIGDTVPNERFFVRNHCATPLIDAASWKLRVLGPGVQREVEVDYEELLSLPARTYVRALECAGNGRRFITQSQGRVAPGVQWGLGAMGVAEWTGVPLRDLLQRAGLKRSAREVMPIGLDELQVRRPLPLAKALEPETMLVYGMNGETLPADHGHPARVLVPDWAAVASIKWVGSLYVSEGPLVSHWNTEEYVLEGPTYRPTEKAAGPEVRTRLVNSALELPWEGTIARGRHVVRGRAWSPHGAIRQVDYSDDRGATWRAAAIEGPNLPGTWARFSFAWNAAPGRRSLRVRATDDTGATQPADAPWNKHGYLNNAVIDHPVRVE
jgi:sulfane dehydrogenase subunit SoxC